MRTCRLSAAGMLALLLYVCIQTDAANVGVYYYPWYGSLSGGLSLCVEDAANLWLARRTDRAV